MKENDAPFTIDTNLFVYAFDKSESRKHEEAKEFLKKFAGKSACKVSSQTLAEFASVVTTKLEKPLSTAEALVHIQTMAEVLATVSYSASTIVHALELKGNYRIHFWDALLAATMRENRVHTIFTENTVDFKKIPGIMAINPFQAKKSKGSKPIQTN